MAYNIEKTTAKRSPFIRSGIINPWTGSGLMIPV